MNNDTIEGNWKQLMGDIQKQWGKLTNDHLDQVKGNRKKLAGVIQENYGIAREDAEKQVSEWEDLRKEMTNKVARGGSK
ncbi:MAG: CsbD family protein [Alphaproteobacteria bacterium]|nr:CsbD family protein [Alphaproteobacteria bacterium]